MSTFIPNLERFFILDIYKVTQDDFLNQRITQNIRKDLFEVKLDPNCVFMEIKGDTTLLKQLIYI